MVKRATKTTWVLRRMRALGVDQATLVILILSATSLCGGEVLSWPDETRLERNAVVGLKPLPGQHRPGLAKQGFYGALASCHLE